ncbi:DNA-directed RNA polymerase subunit E'' [Candidatus Bathyarchaeota archaeon]|nr:DNA-directed RNA polymerase subunit E'' [Candidatus Bathyarchaeota archaeon]MCW3985469.1 DNA-directed RNA polymerase subunit E'' [Candidatus Bathyarchaeota archaeon]
MNEKACRECHTLTTGALCQKCKTATLSDDFSGLVIIIDPEESEIAKVMEIKEKGRYALRVR